MAPDCPDPDVLAEFSRDLLGWPITYRSPDWVVLARAEDVSGLAFQWAPDHRPPVWGDASRPQQIHLDVMVEDLAVAEEEVEKLGATRLPATQGSVWADPAGHPLCLVHRPAWAEPI